jgi:hypothetical protein
MAKANDKSSTIAWIWLHDALMLAIPRFGSVVLAKERLSEWLATGELPWFCMSWKGLDAERIATLDREQRELIDQKNRGWIVLQIFPSVAYHEGDPQFWRANLKIDWEDNGARQQATGGARALGIKVSREHLVALLPEEPREHVEKSEQTGPAEPESPIPIPTTASKRTRAQAERAERYIAKNFPSGTEGITTAKIRETLVQDKDLQTELQQLGSWKVPSVTAINRVLGRRKA